MHVVSTGERRRPGRGLRWALLVLAALLGGQLAGVQPASALTTRGPFNIYNVVTGKCADLPGYTYGLVNGPVNQYTCNYTWGDNQRWYLDYEDGLPLFLIRSGADGLCMDLPGYGTVAAGTPISEYYCRLGQADNQMFRVVSQGASGQYWVVHDKTGLCLDVEGVRTGGNDARLTLWPCKGISVDDHVWSFREW